MHVGNTLTYIFLIMSHSQLVALDDFSNLHNYQNLKNIYLISPNINERELLL